jgi:predicted transcriptional regulator of viral defense system
MSSAEQKILAMAHAHKMIRPRDLEDHGIAREQLRRLHQAGKLRRIARGVYMLPDQPISEHHSLALAIKQAPKAKVCLLSALRFHDLTTQAPHEIWLAMAHNAVLPRIVTPSIRLVKFSGRALEDGVEHHQIDGVDVPVYNAAKTVADCFKFRNKIGLDVAIEALRDARRSRKATMDEIYHFAKICRVATVMRPYMESVV